MPKDFFHYKLHFQIKLGNCNKNFDCINIDSYFSNETSQSKQVHVNSHQNGQSSIDSDRFECSFGAYLEVRL